MMNFKLIVLPCLLSVVTLFGQNTFPTIQDTNFRKHSLTLDGSAFYASSSVRNEILNSFIFGGMIDEDMKDRSFSKHRDVNRLGALAQGELVYANFGVSLFGNENLGFLIKAGAFYGASGAYSKDAFGLFFYGNARYASQTVSLSGSEANFIGMQKIGFGIIVKRSKSSVSLNFYGISDYQHAYLDDGTLAFQNDGSQVDLVLKGNMSYTPERKWNNGYGVGIDADYRFEIDWMKDKKATVQILARNLGVGFMNKLREYTIDSSFQYDGFRFNQLFGDAAIFDSTYSVLDTLGVRQSDVRKVIPLPGYIQAGKVVSANYNGKWQSYFGVRIYPTFSYVPKVHAGVQYKVLKGLFVGSQLAYGGFTGFQWGAYTNLRLNSLSIGVGTENILGLSRSIGYGNSFLCRLQCRF